MLVSLGFKNEKGEFFKIGDEIDIIFCDGSHHDGLLEGIRPDKGEIVIDSVVLELDEIKEINHIN